MSSGQVLKAGSGRFYRPELDVVRFIAFLMVFLHHCLPRSPAGYYKHFPKIAADIGLAIANLTGFGLPLFFFLSALLLTELLLLERERTGRIDIGAFYLRRGLRIWPLYFLGLMLGVLYLGAMTLAHKPLEEGAWVMLGMYALMIGNWFYALGRANWISTPITPLWSISIEEQFYLFWPWLIKLGGETAVRWGSLAMIVTSVIVGGWLGVSHAERDTTIWTNTFVQFEAFAFGALCVLWLRRKPDYSLPPMKRMAIFIGAFCVWFAGSWLFAPKGIGPAMGASGIVFGYAFISLGCGLVILAVWGWRIWHPLLIRLGRISYGLYVYHLLSLKIIGEVVSKLGLPAIFHLAGDVAAFVVTIALAELSYRFFETPFLHLKEKFAKVPSRPT